jgi:hypothetical protein
MSLIYWLTQGPPRPVDWIVLAVVGFVALAVLIAFCGVVCDVIEGDDHSSDRWKY